MSIAAVCAALAVKNVPTEAVIYPPTAASAAPATSWQTIVPNALAARIAMSITVGTVLAVTNATTLQKMNCAVTVGSVLTVWVVFATVAVSARDAGNWKICTARSAATATLLMQSVTLDTITVRNAVSSVSSVRNACSRTALSCAMIAVCAFSAARITQKAKAVVAVNTAWKALTGMSIFALTAVTHTVRLRCAKTASCAWIAARVIPNV